ncbi:MAG: response regulator [Planctomycetes bacterium]|nr:response regulator [Planctomycetota bacterium]
MRLSELTPAMLSRAVDAYLVLAYGSGGGARSRPDLELSPDASAERVLALFQKELVAEAGKASCTRYWMRLGNRNYPFMKLLLQEHIVQGEFFFAVDTHDEMDIKPDFPDYEAWQQIQRFNGDLKRRIEARFVEIGIPTAAALRELVAQRSSETPRAAASPADLEVLVVDDEDDLARTVAELLERRGYRVRVENDGRRGLAAARALRPHLVVLDYEMPELDGLQVIAELRADPATRTVPVLLCTASKVSVQEMRKADGFLAKPYQESLLYEMVDRLLAKARAEQPR